MEDKWNYDALLLTFLWKWDLNFFHMLLIFCIGFWCEVHVSSDQVLSATQTQCYFSAFLLPEIHNENSRLVQPLNRQPFHLEVILLKYKRICHLVCIKSVINKMCFFSFFLFSFFVIQSLSSATFFIYHFHLY